MAKNAMPVANGEAYGFAASACQFAQKMSRQYSNFCHRGEAIIHVYPAIDYQGLQ